MTTQVLIADDHPFVAQGLAEAIAALEGFSVVGVAANGIEAISLVRRLRPDCAIVDYAMPGANGLEVFHEIRRWSPQTRVMILTGHQNQHALGALQAAGVEGLMSKSARPEQILAALQEIALGNRFVDPGIAGLLDRSAAAHSLSPRELEVLRAVARGQSNGDAALALGISPKTVDRHRGNVMRKLGVHSTARLILVAVREGLLDPGEVE